MLYNNMIDVEVGKMRRLNRDRVQHYRNRIREESLNTIMDKLAVISIVA